MFRYGSKQWRISQMTSGASLEETWPIVIGLLAIILIIGFVIHRSSK